MSADSAGSVLHLAEQPSAFIIIGHLFPPQRLSHRIANLHPLDLSLYLNSLVRCLPNNYCIAFPKVPISFTEIVLDSTYSQHWLACLPRFLVVAVVPTRPFSSEQ